jgi:hypothetical protein
MPSKRQTRPIRRSNRKVGEDQARRVKGHPLLRTWGTPTFTHQREWFTPGDLLLSWPGAGPA